MKALNKVGGPVVEEIIKHRPYKNIMDFIARCPIQKTALLSLIKAGAFDRTDADWASKIWPADPRIGIMVYYIQKISSPKSKLTLQNFNTLMQRGLLPDELNFHIRMFTFNNFLKKYCKNGDYYLFTPGCAEFYNEYFDMDFIDYVNGSERILQSNWNKIYKNRMEDVKDWLKNNQEVVLNRLNESLFLETWNKYAAGTIPAWEMESMCFYHHPHELSGVDTRKYGISNYNNLDSNPPVEYFFKRNGQQIPIYYTFKIIGTVIGKNDAKSTVALLTTTGVVTVKFSKEYYAMYNRQLSEVQEDGSKKVAEKGWFTRGTKLLVTGFRRDDMFVAKTYNHTPTHQLYKITEINGSEILIEHERAV